MSTNTQKQGRSLYTERDFAYTPRGDDPLRISQNWEIDLYRQLNVYNPAFDYQAKAAAMLGLPYPPPPPAYTGWKFTAEAFTVQDTPFPGDSTLIVGYMKDTLGELLSNEQDRVVSITVQTQSDNSENPSIILQVENTDGGSEDFLELELTIATGLSHTYTLNLDSGGEFYFVQVASAGDVPDIQGGDLMSVVFGAESEGPDDPEDDITSWIIMTGTRTIDDDNVMNGFAGSAVPLDERFGTVPEEGRLHSFWIGIADGEPIMSIVIKNGSPMNNAFISRNGDEYNVALTPSGSTFVFAGPPPAGLEDLAEGEFVTLEITNGQFRQA